LIVVKRRLKIIHKRQRFPPMRLQTIQQVLGRRLFDTPLPPAPAVLSGGTGAGVRLALTDLL
jgi:hypothetical protein